MAAADLRLIFELARLWDAKAGAEIRFRVHLLPGGAFVSVAASGDRVLHASKEAWRWVGWLGRGPDGMMTRYPAEIFGELPG